MQNPDIARVFDEVADLLEIQDANPFRVRAYRNAARTIRDFPEPIAELVRSHTKELTSSAIGSGKRSEEHTSELQSRLHLVCRLLLEKKKNNGIRPPPCSQS